MVAAALVLAAQPIVADADRDDPESAARGVIALLLAGRFDDGSGDVAAFHDAMRRYACVTPVGTRATATMVVGRHAFVDVIATAAATLPITQVSEEFPSHWRVQLRAQDDGWRVVRVDSAERDLATALAFADPQTQRALLHDCGDLVTPELVRQLVQRGTAIGSKAQFAREERLAAIALGIADELRDPRSRARALWLLARARDSQDFYDEALADYEEARALAEANGDRETTGRALVGLGFTRVNRYEFAQAREPLERGLAIALSVGDFMIADNAHLAMATMHLTSGEYIDAIRDLDRAREYAEKAGDRAVVAAATANAGLVFSMMNNDDLAAERLLEGIRIYREIGNVRGEMRNLRNLADVEAASHHSDAAAAHLDRVEAWLAREPNDRIAAFAAVTRTDIARDRRDLPTADREAARAYALAVKIDDRYLIATMTNALSEIRLEQGRDQEAAELAERAVELSLTNESELELYARARMNSGRAYRKLGRTAAAAAALRAAVDSVEKHLANVPGTEEEQQNFYNDKTEPYYEMFHLLVDQGQPEAALEWVERSRSRTLIEYLGRNRVSADRNVVSPEERREELALQQGIVSQNRTLRELRGESKKDAKRIAQVEDELRLARLALQDFMTQLHTRHPELALARGALPRPSLSAIQKLIPPDGAIVNYVMSDDASWVVVISRTGPPRIATIAVRFFDFDRRLATFANQIARRDILSRSDARKMYQLLLGPVESLLRSKKSLCIIPDGPLWRIPFQALVDDKNRYLIERVSLFYAPSLSLLAWYATHPDTATARTTLLALGNPKLTERTTQIAQAIHRDEALAPLPDAEHEARQLASFYEGDATILIGAEATEERVKRDAGRYRIIHLATHASFDDSSPLYSHLVLAAPGDSAEDGLLEAREIMNLDLAADLVILSSCETGRGHVRRGDGIVGMSWALLMAGCPTAVVSQWKVGSASTAKLMIEFHRRLARIAPNDRRLAAARVLREAQLALLRTRQYRHPYDWSAFMVVGNGW